MTSSALVGRRFLLHCAKEPDIFFAAIRSLKVHGYDKGYMLQTTRKIR
jgi:hypothetical protein